MSTHPERLAEISRTDRTVLMVAQVYFYASIAVGVALVILYWLDWQPYAERTMLYLMILMLAAFVVFPIAMIIVFRTPRWCSERLFLRMMLSVLLFAFMGTVAAGMAYWSIAALYVPAIVYFAYLYRKSFQPEAAHAPF